MLIFQSAATAIAAAYCLTATAIHIRNAKHLPTPGHSGLRDIFNYAWKYQGTALLGLILLNIDKIFLLSKGNAKDFGLYTLAFTTTRVIASVQDSASLSIFSRFAGKQDGELSEAVKKSFRLSFLPMLMATTLISLAAPLFIPRIFGPDFNGMITPFIILSFEAVIGAGSWTLAQRFNAGGRPGLVLLRQGFVTIPLLATLPALPTQDMPIYLAALLLCAAILRLALTIALYPLALGEKLPKFLPSLSEINSMAKNIKFK